MSQHYIGPETIHNWVNRHRGRLYYADLPAEVRSAIRRAHDQHQHHRGGLTAAEAAEALAQQYPDDLLFSRAV